MRNIQVDRSSTDCDDSMMIRRVAVRSPNSLRKKILAESLSKGTSVSRITISRHLFVDINLLLHTQTKKKKKSNSSYEVKASSICTEVHKLDEKRLARGLFYTTI